MINPLMMNPAILLTLPPRGCLPRPSVLEYFRSSTKATKAYDRHAVLLRLPLSLRSKVLDIIYRDTLSAVPLLKHLIDDPVFLTEFCIRLHPTHAPNDTYVYQRGVWWCEGGLLRVGQTGGAGPVGVWLIRGEGAFD